MQACSDLAHVVLVLVGVRRVTVVIVHIGLEGVLVIIHFCVAILFVNSHVECDESVTQKTNIYQRAGVLRPRACCAWLVGRVTVVIVHIGLTDVEGVLVVIHTFT